MLFNPVQQLLGCTAFVLTIAVAQILTNNIVILGNTGSMSILVFKTEDLSWNMAADRLHMMHIMTRVYRWLETRRTQALSQPSSSQRSI